MASLNKSGLEYLLSKIYGVFQNVNTEIKNIKDDTVKRMIEVTYSELKELRDGSKLVPGQQYRITDYVTTTIQEDTKSAGHQFDIIVTADSNNTLNEIARACLHDGDTYFSESDANLEAWQIWYCIDNDTERFAWAADTKDGGKGVIYRMIDAWGNDLPYDFKNIMFKRYILNQDDAVATNVAKDGDLELVKDKLQNMCYQIHTCLWYYGSYITDVYSDAELNAKYVPFGDIYYNHNGPSVLCKISENFEYFYTFHNGGDASLSKPNREESVGVWNNVIKNSNYTMSVTEDGRVENIYNNQYLNDIVFYGNFCHSNTFGTYCISSTFGNDCVRNKFGDLCLFNTFGDSCGSNTFGNECCSNTLGNGCNYNTFGTYCISNTFGNSCSGNTFGNYCEENTFVGTCHDNTFGNSCHSNTFGNHCCSNTFGYNCDENTFGNECGENIFGEDCNENIFSNECKENTFGNKCHVNKFGEKCILNTFGNGCYTNEFVMNCEGNKFSDNCKFNTFGESCDSNTFGNSCSLNKFGTECNYNSFDNICSANTFGNDCDSNTFGNSCSLNKFGTECYSNTFGNSCFSNTFVDYCYYNKFGNDCNKNKIKDTDGYRLECYNNVLGDNCNENEFDSGCCYNTLGNECHKNNFYISCKYNILGNNCYENDFSDGCIKNTLGDHTNTIILHTECESNIFEKCYEIRLGEGCIGNHFGIYANDFEFLDHCNYNKLGDNCSRIFLETGCEYNTFGNSCSEILLGDYCKYNTFGNGCINIGFVYYNATNINYLNNIRFGNFVKDTHFGLDTIHIDETDDISNLRNINVAQGFLGDVDIDSYGDYFNKDYEISIGKNSNGEIKIFCIADLY